MIQDILLIHHDAELLAHLQKELEKNGTTVASSKSAKILLTKKAIPLVVINTDGGDWFEEIKTLQKIKKEGKDFYGIVSCPTMLKKTAGQIHGTALSLNKKAGANGHEPNLAELLEKKLTEFVKKTKIGAGKNLYNLLIEEIEKPLISIALQETRGNQIQAAQLLGMNRNTLRKKIKDLKISIVKGKKR